MFPSFSSVHGGQTATTGGGGGGGVGATTMASSASVQPQQTPVASNHDPLLALSSHCILTSFGPVVQLVADALQSRGPSTLPQLLSYLREKCCPPSSSRSSRSSSSKWSQAQWGKARRRGIDSQDGQPYEPSCVRAALMVLIQHEIVTCKPQKDCNFGAAVVAGSSSPSSPPRYVYSYDPKRARNLLLRLARYDEFLKKSLDEVAASVVQTLFVKGRLYTMDWLVMAVNDLKEKQQQAAAAGSVGASLGGGGGDGGGGPSHHRYTIRQQVVEVVYKLVSQGFVIREATVEEKDAIARKQTEEDEEREFEGSDEDEDEYGAAAEGSSSSSSDETDRVPPSPKRVRIEEPPERVRSSSSAGAAASTTTTTTTHVGTGTEDPALFSLIQGNAHYKSTIPLDAVWKVNQPFLHDYFLLAFHLGRLASDRYGSKVQSCGTMVTAALRYKAHRMYTGLYNRNGEESADSDFRTTQETSTFVPSNIIKHLPKPVLQILEKKPGGLQHNLELSWQQLSLLSNPTVVRCLGTDDATGEERYEVTVRSLLEYSKRRVIHQVMTDRHGEVAARIVRILSEHGWLEAETIAERAMVPVKDTREILHELYRSRYIELMQLSSRSYNPASAYYLWGVYQDRIKKKVMENVATALWRIRLRRQHHIQVGKNWIERAQQSADVDENEMEHDRYEYRKFCVGLERLEFAAYQLDETLLVMNDFDKLES